MSYPHYDMPLYRPPSEGQNLIIQATLGCSSNLCTFCSMYKTKSYSARPLDQVFADIDAAAKDWPGAHRVFLADGDALTLPMDTLRAILEKLAAALPRLTRVSAYATPKNLIDKSVPELAELKQRKLSLVYMGIESGSTSVLKKIIKGASSRTHGMALTRARQVGLKVSATVILGLGGRKGWRGHIEGTAELINTSPPNFLSTLQLGLAGDVVDEFMDRQEADFEMQNDAGILAEQDYLLSLLNPPKPVIFRSNHASNCLPLAGNLPKDTVRLRAEVAAAMAGQRPLRPTFSSKY